MRGDNFAQTKAHTEASKHSNAGKRSRTYLSVVGHFECGWQEMLVK